MVKYAVAVLLAVLAFAPAAQAADGVSGGGGSTPDRDLYVQCKMNPGFPDHVCEDAVNFADDIHRWCANEGYSADDCEKAWEAAFVAMRNYMYCVWAEQDTSKCPPNPVTAPKPSWIPEDTDWDQSEDQYDGPGTYPPPAPPGQAPPQQYPEPMTAEEQQELC